MDISNLIALLGGVALFLFGMTLMGDGLQKVAGNKLELFLYRLSSTPLKGVLLGTGVTAIIQSSSATSVMVVGFVNSGMMKLEQAVTIIEGALIGTSVTGWVICLSSLEGSGGWISLFSTSTITAVVAIIGIYFRMFSKKQANHHIGDILLGFSVLMFGMQAMSQAVYPLRESPEFIRLLTTFSNPVFGILFGALFTAVIQSASASVGILQALSLTGAVTFSTAFPIVLGISIGAAVPVLFSALGSKADGRRTAFLYLLVETASALLCGALYYGVTAFADLGISGLIMSPVWIALVNTVYRAIGVLLLLPFNKWLLSLVRRLIKAADPESAVPASLKRLDDHFLTHPALAIQQCGQTINDMADLVKENFQTALSLAEDFREDGYHQVEENEDIIDQFEDRLGSYLMRINAHELNSAQNKNASRYLHTLSDFERIGDHAMNLSKAARENTEKNLLYSEDAQKELHILFAAVQEILELSFAAFKENSTRLAYRVEPLEECIDILCDELKIRHVERLQKGLCSLQKGFVFNDIITNMERVSDHCSNIAVAVIELKAEQFDTHSYVLNLKEKHAHHFNEYFEEYSLKYMV